MSQNTTTEPCSSGKIHITAAEQFNFPVLIRKLVKEHNLEFKHFEIQKDPNPTALERILGLKKEYLSYEVKGNREDLELMGKAVVALTDKYNKQYTPIEGPKYELEFKDSKFVKQMESLAYTTGCLLKDASMQYSRKRILDYITPKDGNYKFQLVGSINNQIEFTSRAEAIIAIHRVSGSINQLNGEKILIKNGIPDTYQEVAIDL